MTENYNGLELLSAEVRNFCSFGNNITKIPLKFKEPHLIVGENQDVVIDGEYDTNGTGKSTVLNVIPYVCYGKTISPIKVDGLINNVNKKNLYASLTIRKNEKYYKIERWRKNKQMGGTGVKISYGDSLDAIDKVYTPATRSIDKYIAEHIIGMPFEIFSRIVVYSATYESFLDLPITHTTQPSQTSILEEIFGLTELTQKAVKLKESIKLTKSDIKSLMDLNDRIKTERKRYKEQLKLAEESFDEWNETHDNEIKKLAAEIKKISAIDYNSIITSVRAKESLESDIKTLEGELKANMALLSKDNESRRLLKEWESNRTEKLQEYSETIHGYDDIDFDEQADLFEKIDNEVANINLAGTTLKDAVKRITDLNKDIEEIKAKILVLADAICPYCSQEYKDNISKISEEEASIEKLKSKIEEHKTIIKNTKADVVKWDKNILKLKDELVFDTEDDLTDAKQSYTTSKKSFEELELEVNPYLGTIYSDKERKRLDEQVKSDNGQVTNKTGELINLQEGDHSDYMDTDLEDLIKEQASLDTKIEQLNRIKNETNPHTGTIDNLNRAFKNMDALQDDKIDELKKLQKHQEFLLKLLTKKDSFIRQALLDANLPLLNIRLQYYLKFMGLPHNVSFTKEMKVSITQFGNEIDFVNFSAGQRARVNLAIAFAFRDVMQARHGKVNLCVLDECLDTGLSNLGVKLAAKMIKEVAAENNLSMYVITHRDEIKSSFKKQLKTILKGGITTVEFS